MRAVSLAQLSTTGRAVAVAALAALTLALWFAAGPVPALSVGAAGLVLARLRRRGDTEARPARLQLLERRPLGNGSELWLVEVDGRAVLVACGRGHAAIRLLRPGADA
jgi:flagellar biogenesis protein FliO